MCCKTFDLLTLNDSFLETYCILFKTPKTIESGKWILFNFHIWRMFLDYGVTALVVPYMLFPALAGMPLGILKDIGVSWQFQTYLMLSLIPAVSVSIITIFENRYFVVFANDSKWKKYRIPMSLMNYFFAFVWSIPSFFTVPDQAIARRNTWEMLGNIPDFIRSDQIFVISFEFQYLTISCFIFCLVQVPQTFIYVTLMQRGMKKLRKTARFSEKKLKMQNNFLNAIYIQMSSKLFVFLLICYATADKVEKEGVVKSFRLFNWNWDDVHQVYVITTWIFVASLAKILFNLMKPLSKWLPDSSLLIIVGLALGYILRHTTLNGAKLDSHAFFLYLLPPIIFDAGYFMPNRALFKNFDSVLVFSVIGTLWNTFAIGGSLLIMAQYDLFTMSFTTFEILVFSALISAVDPVAVIAVFEEIHVNEFLFINVFGEALFNDGVTVVLYQMFKSFALIGSEHLSPWDYATGGLSFFVVAMGGAAIGIIFAIVTSLATKYTQEIRILAPVFIFLLPYMAYLTAEMVSLSSIIAIAVCGMLMKQYIKGNITEAATNSVKYFTKMLSQCSETVIFMFLGLSTISSEHHVDLVFISATLFFCLIYRAIGVVVQCYVLNKFRAKQFELVDQFILSYGGLRGAIAYGLAVSIPASISAKPMFITTTIAVIYFTVFLQGITIRPLVNCLKIKRKEERDATMVESVYNKYMDYMMSGVEDIAGQRGHYSFIENFERFNAKVIKPVLMRHETRQSFDATSIIRAYEKITLEDAIKLTKVKGALQNKRLEKVKSSSQVAPEQQTVTPKDVQLARVMASGENVEQLYNLFSDLLDKKLGELKKQADRIDRSSEDDIQDDYMAQVGSHSTLQSMHHSAAHLDSGTLFHRGPRRLSTGDLRGNTRDPNKQKHSMFELRHV